MTWTNFIGQYRACRWTLRFVEAWILCYHMRKTSKHLVSEVPGESRVLRTCLDTRRRF
jgi:hypothetical protein